MFILITKFRHLYSSFVAGHLKSSFNETLNHFSRNVRKQWLTLTMRLVREVFLLGCMFASVNLEANAQRTFLDDFAFRPAFRGMRKLMLGFMKNQSPEIAFQTNLRNGVTRAVFVRDFLSWLFAFRNSNGNSRSTSLFSATSKDPEDAVTKFQRQSINCGLVTLTLWARLVTRWQLEMGGSRPIFYKSLSSTKVSFKLDHLNWCIYMWLFPYQGVSFSIGGERTWREFLTIPNILKEFNPNLYGFSVNEGLSIEETSRFNVAELGAMSRDTPYMSKVLVKRMKSDPKVKPTHWKVRSWELYSDFHWNSILVDHHADWAKRLLPRHVLPENSWKYHRQPREGFADCFSNVER